MGDEWDDEWEQEPERWLNGWLDLHQDRAMFSVAVGGLAMLLSCSPAPIGLVWALAIATVGQGLLGRLDPYGRLLRVAVWLVAGVQLTTAFGAALISSIASPVSFVVGSLVLLVGLSAMVRFNLGHYVWEPRSLRR